MTAPASTVPAPATPSFAEAARFWAQLGFVSFGGPAGQIAIMHREVVERRQWLGDRQFTDALNFCMLLPGPEALQLAIFLGWKLHGLRGGLVAGLGFILPAIVLLFALAMIYVTWGEMSWLQGVLAGLKAAVIALVAQALLKIGRKALQTRLHVALAVGAFLALQFLGVPFPVLLLIAALVGWVSSRHEPATPDAEVAGITPAGARAAQRHGWRRIALVGGLLWLAPLLLVAATLGADSLFGRVYLFFSQAALVTFGGAYAVLGYVTHELVDRLQWVTATQSVAGLALAETTPGPLVIVLQFLGFMAGWNQPGALPPLGAALLAGALAAWATFLPSFVFIFLGAPYVERLNRNARIRGALAAITAVVVGVIATLALLLLQVVAFPRGWTAPPEWTALALAAAAWWALERRGLPLVPVLALSALAGLALRLLLFPG
jgi:chromate transporter